MTLVNIGETQFHYVIFLTAYLHPILNKKIKHSIYLKREFELYLN